MSWTASTTPLADWPVTSYEYRVSTDGGGTWGTWGPTGAGTSTMFVHNCGQGVSCTYQVRAAEQEGGHAGRGFGDGGGPRRHR